MKRKKSIEEAIEKIRKICEDSGMLYNIGMSQNIIQEEPARMLEPAKYKPGAKHFHVEIDA